MNGSEENKMENNSFSVPNGAQVAQETPQNFANPEPFLPPEPKKSNKALIIVLVTALVILAIGGGIGYWYLSEVNQKNEVATKETTDEEKEQTYLCSTNVIPQTVTEVNNKLDTGEMVSAEVPAFYTSLYNQAIEQDTRARRVCTLNLLPEFDYILSSRGDYQSELELLTSVDYNELDDGEFTLVEYTQNFYYAKILELAKQLGRQDIVTTYQPLYDETKAAWDEIEEKKLRAIQNDNQTEGGQS